MRRVAIAALFAATAAHAGTGTFFAEAGMGAAGGAACFFVTGLAADAVGFSAYSGWGSAVAGVCYVAGVSSGVWLAGERWAGRSDNRAGSFWGAVGGAVAGGLAAGALTAAVVLATAEDGDVNEEAVIPVGVAVGFCGPPILSTVVYNKVKKPASGGSASLTVTPAVRALPPQNRGDAPTVTFGVAAAF
jgi:hypothetical protein